MTVTTTQADIITAYLNGALAHSAAKSALRAIGFSQAGAELLLKEAWAGKSRRPVK